MTDTALRDRRCWMTVRGGKRCRKPSKRGGLCVLHLKSARFIVDSMTRITKKLLEVGEP